MTAATTMWYEPSRGHRRFILPLLVVLLVVIALGSLTVGSFAVSIREVVAFAAFKLGVAAPVPGTDVHGSVLLVIRLPRVVLGILVGGALAIAGASMQGVFRTPLVDPSLLGVSSGAALGAVAMIVAGAKLARGVPAPVAPYVLPIAAFAGALVAMGIVERIGRGAGHRTASTYLLAGIAVNALAGAFIGLLTYLATDAQLRTITFWTLGSLGGATWTATLATLLFMALPFVVLVRARRALNPLLLGEAEAFHLGVDPARLKRTVLLSSALLVAAAVAVAGILGFVGLVVPHLVRLALGPDHRVLVPGSALLGASLLVASDDLARTLVAPAELPLGILTAALGTPFFLALLLRERRRIA